MVQRSLVFAMVVLPFVNGWTILSSPTILANASEAALLERIGTADGICVVLGDVHGEVSLLLARASRLTIYVQSPSAGEVTAIRRAAAEAGLLGTRIFVDQGSLERLHLADNLADAVVVQNSALAIEDSLRAEILRVLHPNGKALLGKTEIVKPAPAGTDDWSHPYHGPDNNPQSRDAHARAPYLTQFLCEPWYIPMPQVTVASGGRLFKAFGHIALKEREWPWLNTLVAINAYNGTHLWKRPLKPGFMIHRNTIIATPDTLYLADDTSCKLLDAATGLLKDEIVVSSSAAADGVWKWMALENDVLYALIGQHEKPDTVIRGTRTEPGWPWNTLGDGYGGEYAWGFGHTLLAIQPQTKKILWRYHSAEPIDSRALCLAAGRIYVYCHQVYLAGVDAKTGKEIWKTTDPKLLAAIGQHDRAQTAPKGFASTCYVKANADGIYFAGPQRTRLVAVSARDGSLMWDYPHGNFQLVLRDDGLYAMGRMETSKKFDYLTGRVLADLECYRGNCTRATGTVDSIFTRGYRHTGTMRLDLSGEEARRIPLMRPACQDGVVVSNGLLYWGPWMCDCNHSLVGMISLAPAGDFDFAQQAAEAERLEVASNQLAVADLEIDGHDWPRYRSNVRRDVSCSVIVPDKVERSWEFQPPASVEPTAPVTAGGMVFWSGLDGIVRAADVKRGRILWTAYTGGAVRFPPEIWEGRLYVGSGDGWIYCFEATSGRQLWRFRAAPAERKINVHGRLISTWPVGSGVLVDDGVVYAAAGIASYDGTHVYALDALSGKICWQNNTSGRLVDAEQVTGVSVQGHLLLHEGRLYLAGGNVISPAVYDASSGECLNQLKNEWWNRPDDAHERFPSQPETAMFQRSPRGRELFLVDGQVRVFDQLLYSPPVYGPSRYFGGHFLQATAGDNVIRATTDRIVRLAHGTTADSKSLGIWQNATFHDPMALAMGDNLVVVAGQGKDPASNNVARTKALDGNGNTAPNRYVVAAFRLTDGTKVWSETLPTAPVGWGIALERTSRVILALADGRVVCFGP